jgi:hypothetical protein
MEHSSLEHPQISLPLRCHPRRVYWAYIVFLGGMGLLPIFLQSIAADPTIKGYHEPVGVWLGLIFMSAFFLVPAALFTIWLLRACIIADAHGLRWRGLFGSWRSMAWAEITEYYIRYEPYRSSEPLIVEAPGRQMKFDKDWSDMTSLRTVIQTQATSALAHDWGIQGTRLEDDWPRVFSYNLKRSRYAVLPVLLIVLLFTIPSLCWLMPDVFRAYQANGSLWDALPSAVLPLFFLSMAAFLIVSQVEDAIAGLRWAEQRIVVDPKGITYGVGDEKAEFAWKEITDYYIRHTGGWRPGVEYVIKTASGDIRFSPGLKDAALLKATVRRYVTAANGRDWRYAQDPNTLGGVAAKWSGGREGVGQRIYHYRTGLSRAYLFGLVAFAVTLLLEIGIERRYEIAPLNNAPAGIHIADALLLLYVWSLWRYRTAQIRTDADGVWQYTVLGRRFLAWPDVQDYCLTGPEGNFGNVVGSDRRHLWFWNGIADSDELKEEIARRAVHCQGQAWEKKERRAAVVNR